LEGEILQADKSRNWLCAVKRFENYPALQALIPLIQEEISAERVAPT